MNIKELHEKYLGEKCGLSLFYKRIYAGIPLEEAIKPVKKEKCEVRSKLFYDELKRYYEQPDPKAGKARFYGRLCKGYSKEEAIKVELIVKERKKPKFTPAYVPQHTQSADKKQDDREIRITYKKEEADVFRNIYKDMINDLERTIVEDEAEAKSLQVKIDELKDEYFIFNHYNHE